MMRHGRMRCDEVCTLSPLPSIFPSDARLHHYTHAALRTTRGPAYSTQRRPLAGCASMWLRAYGLQVAYGFITAFYVLEVAERSFATPSTPCLTNCSLVRNRADRKVACGLGKGLHFLPSCMILGAY